MNTRGTPFFRPGCEALDDRCLPSVGVAARPPHHHHHPHHPAPRLPHAVRVAHDPPVRVVKPVGPRFVVHPSYTPVVSPFVAHQFYTGVVPLFIPPGGFPAFPSFEDAGSVVPVDVGVIGGGDFDTGNF